MPLPLLAIGIGAATGALMEAINEFQSSGDPQALQAARQARGQAIMDAMAQGMSRMEAEQNVDASVLDAIKRNEQGVNAGNIIGGAVVGGALGGLGAAAAGTKWGAKALSKIGLGRGAAAEAGAAKAGARRLVKPSAPKMPQAPEGLDDLTAMAPSAERGLAQIPGRSYGSVNAADPMAGARTAYGGVRNAEVMSARGVGPVRPGMPPVQPRTYDVVPEPYGGNLTYIPKAQPPLVGYNPSRVPPSTLTSEEAYLIDRLSPGPSSPFTPPGTGMPPMMVQNMMAQGEADAIRAAAAARQAAWKRRLGTITGD